MKCGNACGGWARPLAAGDQWEIIKQVGREGRESSGLAWLRRVPKDGEK